MRALSDVALGAPRFQLAAAPADYPVSLLAPAYYYYPPPVCAPVPAYGAAWLQPDGIWRTVK